jgi:hypothetical protein
LFNQIEFSSVVKPYLTGKSYLGLNSVAGVPLTRWLYPIFGVLYECYLENVGMNNLPFDARVDRFDCLVGKKGGTDTYDANGRLMWQTLMQRLRDSCIQLAVAL